jgi:hypothetical protein
LCGTGIGDGRVRSVADTVLTQAQQATEHFLFGAGITSLAAATLRCGATYGRVVSRFAIGPLAAS